MASRIANPDNVPREVTTGYQAQNNVLYASMTGFVNINMSGTGLLSEGSVVEVNGVLFKCIEDETIDNLGSIPLNSIFYVYAMPITDEIISFSASTKVPQWYTTKGGYYSNDNDRALIRAMRDANGAIVGATLMTNVLTNSVYANEGGILNYSKSYKVHESIALNPGWYRFELCSGAGGGNGSRGADGNYNSGGSTGAAGGGGGVPNSRNYNNNIFYHQSGNITVHIGGNGYNGGSAKSGGSGGRHSVQVGALISNGGGGAGGGGGGSGAGEESYITSGGNKYAAAYITSGGGGAGGTGGKGISGGVFGDTGIGTGGGKNGGVLQTYANGLTYIGSKGGGSNTNGENCTYGTDGFGGGGAGGGGGTDGPYITEYNGSHGGSGEGGVGGDGGAGGAPGWFRANGDGNAGYCKIYYLGE